MNTKKLKGNAILLLVAILWGFSFVSQSVGVTTLEPLTFNGIRTLLGAFILIPFLIYKSVKSRKKRNKDTAVSETDKKKQRKFLLTGGLLCGFALCAASTFQTYGMRIGGVSAGKAAFISALYIVLVPLIGLFFGKKFPVVAYISIAVSIVGLYFLCIDGNFIFSTGDILILVSALFFAVHILLIDFFSPKTDVIKLAFMQFYVAGMINVVFMYIFESPDYSDILSCWLPIVYSGAVACGIAYTLQIIAQRYTTPDSAAIIMSTESLFAVLGGWILLNQKLSAREILGCLLVFIAVVIILIPERNILIKRTKL